jgi:hypothetical protein
LTRQYANPNAFKDALKARVKRRARTSGRLFNRALQIELFDRFLARVYAALGDAVILKGGYAMELRLARARTTKDVDVRVEGDVDEIIQNIREEAAREGEDFLTFDLGDAGDFEEMLGDQIVYGGRRVRVQAKLAGRDFGEPFRLDISVGDRLVMPPDSIRGSDLFEFVGLEPLEHRVYPAAAHVAEKLHALTLEFEDAQNSRAKDLVDIGLLAATETFVASNLRDSIDATFEFRDTHPIPSQLPAPPEFWGTLYERMLEEDELMWDSVVELHQYCAYFLNPVLAAEIDASAPWVPEEGVWS